MVRLGIFDLVVAVGIGALAGSGPAQVIHTSPSTQAVTLMPLVLIPAVAVPLAVALHVVSLISLRKAVTLDRSRRKDLVSRV